MEVQRDPLVICLQDLLKQKSMILLFRYLGPDKKGCFYDRIVWDFEEHFCEFSNRNPDKTFHSKRLKFDRSHDIRKIPPVNINNRISEAVC